MKYIKTNKMLNNSNPTFRINFYKLTISCTLYNSDYFRYSLYINFHEFHYQSIHSVKNPKIVFVNDA